VLLHHTFSGLAVPSNGWHYPVNLLVHLAKIGWLGVSLFLVLSGFCLFYPLAARYDLDKIHLQVSTFARRRAWRILPPYYVALVLLAGLEISINWHHSGQWTWHSVFSSKKDILLHLLMLHNLTSETIASVSPAFWSLALECQLYVIFPLLVFCAARFGLKSILVGTFAITIFWQIICFHRLGFSMAWTNEYAVWYHALPGRCFEFAAGMVAAFFVARPRAGQEKIAGLLVVVLLGPALYFVLKVSRFGPFCDQAWGLIFAGSLVLLRGIPVSHFDTQPLLRGLVWTGTISYSIYLMHQPLISIISPHMMHLPETLSGYYVAGFLRLPLLIAIGYGFHLLFERPFMPGRPRTERQAEIAAIVSPAP